MNKLWVIISLFAISCSDSENSVSTSSDTTSTSVLKTDVAPNNSDTTALKDGTASKPDTVQNKVYANQRFREVSIARLNEHTFRISGRAQVFEASFSWVVEDGHEELKQGHQMTDAGAPEWGRFSFTVDVKKKRPNSTLHLILFEISAKDGSRQHELPIKLY